MKICNLCNRIYADETNFCLEDGTTLSFHSLNSGQNATVLYPLEHETPTIVRFDGIAKSQKPKQISRSVKNTMIGTLIFFLLVSVFTRSDVPLFVGVIAEFLLFGCAKIYVKLRKN